MEILEIEEIKCNSDDKNGHYAFKKDYKRNNNKGGMIYIND